MQRLKLFLPLLILVILLPLFYFGLHNDPKSVPSALLGKPLPDFSLTQVQAPDLTVGPGYFKEKVTLLNVWATWCYACRAEHPYLNILNEQGIHLVGLNYKDERIPAIKWLETLHDPYQFSVYDNEGRLGLDLGVTGAPETYVVDKLGTIRYRHIGVINEKVWRTIIQPVYEKLLYE